jgi:hypothetical protein
MSKATRKRLESKGDLYGGGMTLTGRVRQIERTTRTVPRESTRAIISLLEVTTLVHKVQRDQSKITIHLTLQRAL